MEGGFPTYFTSISRGWGDASLLGHHTLKDSCPCILDGGLDASVPA